MAARAVCLDVMGTLFDLSAARRRLEGLGAPPWTLEAWFGRLLHVAATVTLIGDYRPFPELARPALGASAGPPRSRHPGAADRRSRPRRPARRSWRGRGQGAQRPTPAPSPWSRARQAAGRTAHRRSARRRAPGRPVRLRQAHRGRRAGRQAIRAVGRRGPRRARVRSRRGSAARLPADSPAPAAPTTGPRQASSRGAARA